MSQRRPLKAKKLLVAKLGVGAVAILACGAFPGCNYAGPPSCEVTTAGCCNTEGFVDCPDFSVPEDLAPKKGDL